MTKKNAPETILHVMKENDFEEPTSADEVPKDQDWHSIITARTMKIPGSDGKKHEFLKSFSMEVGFFNGEFWTLGDSKPEEPVVIYGYDKKVRMKSSKGKPITSEGAMRLLEAVMTQAHDDYVKAYAAWFENQGDEVLTENLNRAEREIPFHFLHYSLDQQHKVIESLKHQGQLLFHAGEITKNHLMEKKDSNGRMTLYFASSDEEVAADVLKLWMQAEGVDNERDQRVCLDFIVKLVPQKTFKKKAFKESEGK